MGNNAEQADEIAWDDPRVKLILATMKKYDYQPDSIIQLLHVVQNSYGYLPMNLVRYVTKTLGLPPSRVYGIATFYHFFSLKPQGEHVCLVCTGTACYVKGSGDILKSLEDSFGMKPGSVGFDNKIGLQSARCIGACGLAPAVVFDDEVIAKATPDRIKTLIEEKVGALDESR